MPRRCGQSGPLREVGRLQLPEDLPGGVDELRRSAGPQGGAEIGAQEHVAGHDCDVVSRAGGAHPGEGQGTGHTGDQQSAHSRTIEHARLPRRANDPQTSTSLSFTSSTVIRSPSSTSPERIARAN